MASRILLADDSITIQKVVNLTFADEGIDVVSVSNGDQAEKRLGDLDPDIVLADIFMPGKNGYELCELIKNSPQFRHIPVVLLVGAFEPFDQNEARRVKADDHLTKPFESRKLVDTVRRLISKNAKPEAPPPAEQEKPRRNTDPLGSSPLAAEQAPPPAPNRGFAPMTEMLSSPEMVHLRQQAESADASVLNYTRPLDGGYGDYGGSDSVTPSGFQESGPFPAQDFDFGFDADQPRTTQEMASPGEGNPAVFDALDAVEIDVPLGGDIPQAYEASPEATAEVFDDPARGPQDFDAGPRGSGTPSAFGYSAQEMILDFDRVEGPGAPVLENVVSFDVDAADVPQPVEVSSHAAERDALSTTLLDPSAWQPRASNFSAGQEYESAESVATSTLLAVDEPLGDVLMGDVPQAEAPFDPRGMYSPMSEPLSEPLSSHAPLDVEDPFAVPPAGYDHQTEVAPVQEAPPVDDSLFTAETIPLPDPPFEVAAHDAEQPSSFTTSEEGWAEESQYSPQTFPVEAPTTPEPLDAKFTSSSMWTDEEARFAPIDIEASPVDELDVLSASSTDTVEQETGFEFTPVAVAQIKDGAGGESASSQAGPAQQAPQLSPAMIDEIVRRVVAEMSDSVVREIAWEVVPDSVERVIEKVARESLSKRS